MGVEVAAANGNFLAIQAGRDRFTGFVAPNYRFGPEGSPPLGHDEEPY
jgi:hypothetical protein